MLALLIHGSKKLPEIAKILTELTGQTFDREGMYQQVRRLVKRHLVVDSKTGEEKVEFRGVEVPAQGLGLSTEHSEKFLARKDRRESEFSLCT